MKRNRPGSPPLAYAPASLPALSFPPPMQPVIGRQRRQRPLPTGPSHNGGSDETAYSALQQITTRRISASSAWPGRWCCRANPPWKPRRSPSNGVLYFTGTQGKVYAVDGATGKTALDL